MVLLLNFGFFNILKQYTAIEVGWLSIQFITAYLIWRVLYEDPRVSDSPKDFMRILGGVGLGRHQQSDPPNRKKSQVERKILYLFQSDLKLLEFLQLSPPNSAFEDDFPCPNIGYVGSPGV